MAVDGISLTINACHGSDFSINIIPHTLTVTTLGFRDVGGSVNLEADIVGKYIEKIISRGGDGEQKKDIDLNFLAEHGFLKGR